MKLTIKDIKEKCENDDKINFKGIVEKVWQFNEKKSKFSIGYQNIIVKDDTGKIKVIFSSIKTKSDIYDKSIEGEEVEVSGKVSLYKGEINIFGKLEIQGEEKKPKPQSAVKTNVEHSSPVAELSVGGITREEIRIKCLELAATIYKAETEVTTKEWIAAAKIFEGYICQDKPKEKKSTASKEKPKEKKEEGEEELSQEHIKQINILMALAENRGEEGKEIIKEITKEKGYKTVKDFNKNDIIEATKILEQMGTNEIPF